MFTKDCPPINPIDVPVPTILYCTGSPVSNLWSVLNVIVSFINDTAFAGAKILNGYSSTKTGSTETPWWFPPRILIVGFFLILDPPLVTKISWRVPSSLKSTLPPEPL